MQNNDQNEKAGDKINDFVQKNRKAIFMILGIIVFLLAGSVVVLSVSDVFRKKAIAEVEELSRRYEDLRHEITSESHEGHDHGDGSVDVDVETLLNDLNTFAKSKSGFAGGKAWSIIAQIHSDKKEWPAAEDAWLKAAKAASKTYLGPISFFSGAVAAEEQGKWEQAVELYEKSISLPVEFPAAPHAQFSIGRLYEDKLNNIPAAIEAYRLVLIKWPNITTWVNLANSRIIALENR